MEDSVAELEREVWTNNPTPWTRTKTGEHGVVISSPLPPDEDLSSLLIKLWKKELRLWWSAWTEGIHVLEPRSWWRSNQQFHVWCVSPSSAPLEFANAEEATGSECANIILKLHARKLAHGALNKFAFFRGSVGLELSPPINRSILSTDLRNRIKDDEFFFVQSSEEKSKIIIQSDASAQITATLVAEALSFYELLYYCEVEDEDIEGFPRNSRLLRLLKNKPHPELGTIKRTTADQFYHSMLREMEGEQLGLVLSQSPNPFDIKGTIVSVLGNHPNDEDCLVIMPESSEKFTFEKGWCHPKDIGTSNLIERKRATLEKATQRKHIQRLINQSDKANQSIVERSTLTSAILQNEGVYCVQGPPGTGKTHLACDIVGALLGVDPDARILVCAKEHQALHILRQKLLSRFKEKIESYVTLSSSRDPDHLTDEGSSFEMARAIIQKVPEASSLSYWRKSIEDWNGQPPPILEMILEDTVQVVFATTTSWPMNLRRFAPLSEPFDFVVIEEAGKCYPSELFAPLAISRKALLIGDQKQLPPFQLDETRDAIDYLRNLYSNEGAKQDSKIQQWFGELDVGSINWEEAKSWLQPFVNLQRNCPSFMLQDQYRMIPVISDLISNTFYSTRFVNRKSEEDSLGLFKHPKIKDLRLVWIDVPYWTENDKAREDLTGHRFNKMEMAIIAKILRELEFCGTGNPDVVILSPYNAQVDRLSGNKGLVPALPERCERISRFNPRASVHTVDSFQGNEADLVIVSLVRNNPFGNPNNAWGFLLNPERLNVMFSRARKHLIVVGCSSMIDLYSAYEEMKPLSSVLEYFRRCGEVLSTKELGVFLL
jgi:hypothetical protein